MVTQTQANRGDSHSSFIRAVSEMEKKYGNVKRSAIHQNIKERRICIACSHKTATWTRFCSLVILFFSAVQETIRTAIE
jgi:hypothetical protein